MDPGPHDSAATNVRRGATAEEPVVLLSVHVVPKASRSEIVGLEGETIKVRVAAPPTKGKANKELIKLLAGALGVTKSQVEIVSGQKARHKRLRVHGVSGSTVLALLQPEQVPRSNSNVEL
jgi:uncharacterized protein (TIGR00251 family)